MSVAYDARTDTVDEARKQKISEIFAAATKEIGRVNIAVLGKTGAGKSSLINAVFGEEVAITGHGQPVTQHLHMHLLNNGHLGLLDTRGLELSDKSSETILQDFHTYRARYATDTVEAVHAVWYCVQVPGARIEPFEEKVIRSLAEDLGLPVILVLTKGRRKEGRIGDQDLAFQASCDELQLPTVLGSHLTSAIKDEWGFEQFGIEALVESTRSVVPKAVKGAFVAAQIVDLKAKRRACAEFIKIAAAGAVVVGASPIPFSDKILLVPVQLAMMAKISTTYGMSIQTATLAAVSATSAMATAGPSAVATLLKFLPGIGTVAGGAIAAGVASGSTILLGQVWLSLCERVFTGEISSDIFDSNADLLRFITNDLKKRSSS